MQTISAHENDCGMLIRQQIMAEIANIVNGGPMFPLSKKNLMIASRIVVGTSAITSLSQLNLFSMIFFRNIIFRSALEDLSDVLFAERCEGTITPPKEHDGLECCNRQNECVPRNRHVINVIANSLSFKE
mmetsp:Transcript_8044/g.10305  ORF Transcript_8044/g.10305 Transcript_8044/m.10305 type:complete len:130 (+) Transcript_8044:680-1069(+)